MELFAAKPVANSKGTASMSHKISRRALLQTLCSGTAAGILAPQLPGFSNVRESKQEGNGSRAAMFRIARAFMNKYEVPGLSVSITRHGKFVYEHQFGMAVREQAQQLLPNSLFRIASVTKPITSVTIFTLIEKGKLNLNDKVFGPSGILDEKYGKPPYKQYITDVTVDNLLTHTSGGWPNDSTDPMFRFDSWDQSQTDLLDSGEFAAHFSAWTALGLLQFRILPAGPCDRAGHRPALRGLRSGQHPRALRNQRYAHRRK